jgi:AcrR family transcriptional regulator
MQERSIATRAELLEAAARVFSRVSYAEARLKDVSDESGISPGSMYFHFGNKVDIALAILEMQQERMSATLTAVVQKQATGLDLFLAATDGLAQLIATDVVVQAGIKLSMQPSTDLGPAAEAPYFEWIETAESLIRRGIEDESIQATVDAKSAAEYSNVVFIGAQVLSELEDSWRSFPDRLRRMRPYILNVLDGGPVS